MVVLGSGELGLVLVWDLEVYSRMPTVTSTRMKIKHFPTADELWTIICLDLDHWSSIPYGIPAKIIKIQTVITAKTEYLVFLAAWWLPQSCIMHANLLATKCDRH